MHSLKPLYRQFAGPPGVGPFHESEEPVPNRLHAALATRIVTVNDDVTGAQFDPVANLSIEVVHDSFCFVVCSFEIFSGRALCHEGRGPGPVPTVWADLSAYR
jgi:hypothetical protein